MSGWSVGTWASCRAGVVGVCPARRVMVTRLPCPACTLGCVTGDVHPYLAGPYPRAFAHRGWHVGDLVGMENSLSAFRRACVEGYRYVETDVHVTSDGVVVVHHDAELDRTTDGRGVVSGLPWSVVGRALVGGREPVARLDAVLEELPGVLLNIDVKSDAAVEPVLSTLRWGRGLGRVVHVWTIDDEARMRALLDAGVDGLVTDRPDVLRSVLRSRGV